MNTRTTNTVFITIAAVFAMVAAGLPVACSAKSMRKRPVLVIVSYGGTYQRAQRKAFFEPFEKKYHVRVRERTWNGALPELKARVKSGHPGWDVVAVEDYMVPHGAAQNLYERIDYSRVPRAELMPQAISDYGVAICFWSTVLAYNTNSFQAGARPADWKQFWNVKDFAGTRSLRDDPVGNLEIALLAAGTPRDKMYPLDIDAAFRSLDRIRPFIKVWWKAGAQPARLLGSGRLAMASAWNGRVFDAGRAGKPEAMSWKAGLISSDWWVIPRGASHPRLAQQFIAFASSAQPQSKFPTYIPYGPVNRKAIALIPPGILKNLPTAPENVSKQVFKDPVWWSKHHDEVLKRWNAWRSQASTR